MKNKSFMQWLSDQDKRDDVVGVYSRAVIDDFKHGNRFGLIKTTSAKTVDGWGVDDYSHYCKANALPANFANVLILGNTMAVMEFNVGLLTGAIPCEKYDDDNCDVFRARIAACCEILPAIIQDIESDYLSLLFRNSKLPPTMN